MCPEIDDCAQAHGLTPFGTADAEAVRVAVARHAKELWYYYTPFLTGLARSDGRSLLVGRHEGSILLFLARAGRGRTSCDLVVPPLPFSIAATQWGVSVCKELAGVDRARILWCDERDASHMEEASLGRLEPQAPDLIYDPRYVAELSGGELADVRKRVRRVLREHDITVRRAGPTDLDVCMDLLQGWFEDRVRRIKPIGDMGYTRGALTMLSEAGPPLFDCMLYTVGDEPVALSICGEIRPGRVCFFALKARADRPGLSTLARWETLNRLRGRGLVNDGSALGRPGLEQHKRKFRPVAELPVFEARLA